VCVLRALLLLAAAGCYRDAPVIAEPAPHGLV
jgi:hypothetical protein